MTMKYGNEQKLLFLTFNNCIYKKHNENKPDDMSVKREYHWQICPPRKQKWHKGTSEDKITTALKIAQISKEKSRKHMTKQ